jgi:hypothetical protein
MNKSKHIKLTSRLDPIADGEVLRVRKEVDAL